MNGTNVTANNPNIDLDQSYAGVQLTNKLGVSKQINLISIIEQILGLNSSQISSINVKFNEVNHVESRGSYPNAYNIPTQIKI